MQEFKGKTPVDLVNLQAELNPQEALENKLDRYAKAKKRTRLVLEYIIHLINSYPQQGSSAIRSVDYEFKRLKKLRDELRKCGSFLMFRHFYTKAINKLISGCTCKKHLLCDLCAIRRASKQMRAYHEKFKQVMNDNPGLKQVMITLTIKNGDDLSERFRHVTKSLKVLTERRRQFSLGSRKELTSLGFINGAVWSYEVSNIGNGWHPHCHMLALVDKELNVERFQDMLEKEWYEVTKDSFMVEAHNVVNDGESIGGSFCEVFKYALKSNDMSVENLYQAYLTLRGKRLIASIGSLFGVEVSEDLHDDIEEELKTLPYVDMLFRYSETFGYQEFLNYNIPLSEVLATKEKMSKPFPNFWNKKQMERSRLKQLSQASMARSGAGEA